ncbi:MAG TPA: acyltransferase [Chitinophagales bacterium]|nr:acyltransferase [Chitinophagales bacterium]
MTKNTNNANLNSRHYFPNLIGLRFWMALTVIYRHIEEVKYMRHIQHDKLSIVKFHSVGYYPMLMFFTLSGFLISYQLEVEKKNTGNIVIRKFYKNGALRILPLYYLSIFVYWVLMPNSPIQDYYNTIFFKPWSSGITATYYIPHWVYFFLSVVLLPHLANVILLVNERAWMYGVQHWSVGVEEIFYIFWPIFWKRITSFKKFIVRSYLLYLGLMIGVFLAHLIFKKLLHNELVNFTSFVLFSFLSFSNLSCFFIGAVGIYIYLYRNDLTDRFVNKTTFLIALFIILFFMFSSFEFPFFINEIVCSCYMLVVLYLLKTNKRYLIFEHPLFVYLGKITYAVYLVHFAVIVIVMNLLERFNLQHSNLLLFNILQYAGTLILTFSISALLYEYYEKKFLAMR